MSEFMVFIWIVGWMFAFGASLQNSMDNGEGKFLAIAVGFFLSAFLWPIHLGAIWTKK